MKTHITTLFLLLLSLTGFSQKQIYQYTGRSNPSVKQEKLKDVQTVNDLTPDLWERLIMPFKEREELERRRKKEYSVGFYLYPQGGYAAVVEYVSVEISAKANGKTVTVKSAGSALTATQKNILAAADANSDLRIKISYKYKNYVDENLDVDTEIKQGNLDVSIVPDKEAEYPGGFKQLTSYLTANVFNKLSAQSIQFYISNAIVTFTVNERGEVVHPHISRTSGDFDTDRIVIDAISKMPAWKPAKNSKGVNVEEEFSIPLGSGGC